LWEYNSCIAAYQDRQKSEVSNAILTGYYTAYYMNGGKKAKSPNDLIKEMYESKSSKQSLEEGLRDIDRVIALERRNRQASQKQE